MTLAAHSPDVLQDQRSGSRRQRAAPGIRRFGYVVAILVNVALIVLINEWPGWQEITFLTGETADVVPLVNASLVISIAVNAVYLVADPLWLRALGEAITAAVTFVVIAVVFAVWPFDFSTWSFDWTMLFQILGVIGLVGSLVAVVTNLVRFTKEVGGA